MKVLIIGASSGIGLDLAKYLLSKDIEVICAQRTDTSNDINCKYVYLDLLDNKSIVKASESIEKIDCIVFNSGIAYYGPIIDMDPKKVDEVFKTNVLSVHTVLHYFLPKLNKPGKILFTESIASQVPLPYMSVYSASKSALLLYANLLRLELKGEDIDVITIRPGFINTPFYNRPLNLQNIPSTNDIYVKGFLKYISKRADNGTTTDSTVKIMYNCITSKHTRNSYCTTLDARMSFILYNILPKKIFYSVVNKLYLDSTKQ